MSKDAVKAAADAHVHLIPQPYDELYKALGYDNFALLFNYFGGQEVYIPTMRNVLSDAIKTQAALECEKRMQTYEQIARKYGYNGRYLRKILDTS